jgi:hypothetical protein
MWQQSNRKTGPAFQRDNVQEKLNLFAAKTGTPHSKQEAEALICLLAARRGGTKKNGGEQGRLFHIWGMTTKPTRPLSFGLCKCSGPNRSQIMATELEDDIGEIRALACCPRCRIDEA